MIRCRYSIEGAQLARKEINEYLGRSLMLVTAVSPHIGYYKAPQIAHKADDEGTSLRDAAPALSASADDFDRIVDPEAMVGNPDETSGSPRPTSRHSRCGSTGRRLRRRKQPERLGELEPGEVLAHASTEKVPAGRAGQTDRCPGTRRLGGRLQLAR